MSSVLEGVEQLERELTPEPMVAPAAGSVGLHLALLALLAELRVDDGVASSQRLGKSGSWWRHGGQPREQRVAAARPGSK